MAGQARQRSPERHLRVGDPADFCVLPATGGNANGLLDEILDRDDSASAVYIDGTIVAGSANA
ncbi:MAG: hypothetical protein AAF581_15190 [Planctomycetota bacterium]